MGAAGGRRKEDSQSRQKGAAPMENPIPRSPHELYVPILFHSKQLLQFNF
jgi:hypothetical protein